MLSFFGWSRLATMAAVGVGTPTSSAHSNCSFFRLSRPDFVDASFSLRYQRDGLILLPTFRLRRRFTYAHVFATLRSSVRRTSPCSVPENLRCFVGLELGRSAQRYYPPRATEGIDYVAIDGWDKAAESGKEFVTDVLKALELRRRKWTRMAAVVGIVILAGVLASKHGGGRAACLSVGATILLFALVDHRKLRAVQLIAVTQLEALSRAIVNLSHGLQKEVASFPSSNSKSKNSCDNALHLTFVGNPTSGNLVPDDGKPDVELVVTNIAKCVAQLMSIINSDAVSAANTKSLSGVMSGIEYLRQDLQSVETALIAKTVLLYPKPKSMLPQLHDNSMHATARVPQIQLGDSGSDETSMASAVKSCHGETADWEKLRKSNSGNYGQKTQQLSTVNLVPDDESLTVRNLQFRAVPVHPDLVSESHVLRGDTCLAAANEGTVTERFSSGGIDQEENFVLPVVSSLNAETEILSPEAVEAIPENPVTRDVVSGVQKSSPMVDNLVGVQKLGPDEGSLIEEQFSLSHQARARTHDRPVLSVGRIRSKSPDPWLTSSTGSFGSESLTTDHHVTSLSGKWGSNDDGKLLDLVLIAGQNSNSSPKDGIGTWRGISANSNADFWGKNVGSKSKIEQRGTLTRRRATGRGGFGSVHDLDDDQPQDRRNRGDGDLRKEMPSRTGRLWDEQQAAASGRVLAKENDDLWWNEPPTDDYEGGRAESRGPQLDMRNIASAMDRERKTDEGDSIEYPSSVQRRFSPQSQIRPSSSSPKSQEEETESQVVDENARDGSRDVNEEYRERNRTWDEPQHSDGRLDRSSQVGSQGGIRGSDSSDALSQLERRERNLALQQSKQSQSQKFDMCIDEGQVLLNEGMQGLEGRIEVGVAERMLDKAAKLFERASEMNPSNLTAVGLWGNTLLVHGQLKLRLSQQLRDDLPQSFMSFSSSNGVPISEKERRSVEVTLQDVCEECEELLVDAGRMYRKALSLDKSDVRALYNWGLALCYRGQLIADEDGERAVQDADKLYMAAIDKFQAILGLGQEYGPGALVNWGLALRDRARLRAMGDKERVKLVQQAKGLFLEAVRLDPNYGQARGAVGACSAELAELEDFAARERENRGKPARNWW